MKRDTCAVLFVLAPGGAARGFSEHLGTAYLRAILQRARIGSRAYLPAAMPSLSGFASALRALRPRVVGFTAYESNLGVTRAMARAVRETLPGAAILVGGPNATFVPDETLDLVGADACLRGAGEGTIVSLVEAILGAESVAAKLPELLRNIPNLVLRGADGTVRTAAADLSSFPAAYFRTLDDIPSPFQDGVIETPDVGYLTARGCNQSCTYCSFAAISGRRVAFHSVERVLDDLEAIQVLARRKPPRGDVIPICDDAFTLVPERARRICEGILERRIRLPLWCETRGDRAGPDLLRLMRRAGFTSIAFGLESAVPRVLRAIGKVRPPEATGDPEFRAEADYLARFREAVQAAQACGLEPHVSVIGGLPGETAAEFRMTLDFVASLGVKTYSHNILSLFPGTPLYDRRLAFGLDVFREPATGDWRTVHAYPAEKVEPLRHSSVHQEKWDAAQSLADALCGRPGETEAAEGAVWAVVVHGARLSRTLASWLRRTLAIGGSVVTLAPSRASVARWSSFLARERVPFGRLDCLVPDRRNGHDGLGAVSATGVSAGARLRFVSVCSPSVAAVPVQVDPCGDCTVPLWIASARGVRFEGLPRGSALAGPGLQIADSCRLRADSPHCGEPRVLHVDSRGLVRACWHGPPIGAIRGKPARERTACVQTARCPLKKPRWLNRHRQSRLWDLDLASQMSWVFQGEIERSVT